MRRFINKMIVVSLVAGQVLGSVSFSSSAKASAEEKKDDIFFTVDDNQIVKPGKYGNIEMPWDNNVPAVDDSTSVSDVDEMLGEEVEKKSSLLKKSTDDSAYPAHYEQDGDNSVLNNYLQNSLPTTRDQSVFGDCWAHSAASLAENYAIKQQGASTDVDYSERHLVHYTYTEGTNPRIADTGDILKYNKSVTEKDLLNLGGNTMFAANTLAKWRGVVDESKAPHPNNDDELSPAVDWNDDFEYDSDARLKDCYLINIKENADVCKKYIKEYGSIAISYYSANKYYDSVHHSYYCPKNYVSNHVVTVVGWDDDFSKEYFKDGDSIESDGAWLVRNSWSTAKNPTIESATYNNYFWLSYEDAGLTDAAYVFKMYDKDSWNDNNYFYDTQVHTTNNDLGVTSVRGCQNVFTANSNSDFEIIRSVSFQRCIRDVDGAKKSGNIPYKIKVSVGGESSEKCYSDAFFKYTQSGEIPFSGYYTIDLDKPVLVPHGYTFGVEVVLDNGNEMVDVELGLGYEDLDFVYSSAGSKRGQSYFYYDYTLSDGLHASSSDNYSLIISNNGEYHRLGNFCIGAQTDNVTLDKLHASVSLEDTDVDGKKRCTISWDPLRWVDGYWIMQSVDGGKTFTNRYEGFVGCNMETRYSFFLDIKNYPDGIMLKVVPSIRGCDDLDSFSDIVTIGSNESANVNFDLDCDSVIYNGTNQCPVVSNVTANGETVEEGRYLVNYSNNKSVGTATVTVTLTGESGYCGKCTKEFTIAPVDLEDADVVFDSCTFNGREVKPGLTVSLGDGDSALVLERFADYKVTYSDNVQAGEGTATITGIGNCTGEITRKFTISPAEIVASDVSYTVNGEKVPDEPGFRTNRYVFYGEPVTCNVAAVKVGDFELVEGIDYVVSYEDNNKAGTAYLVITGIGNYCGVAKNNYTIVLRSIQDADIELVNGPNYEVYEYWCNFYPEVIITYKGEVLTEGVDYTAEYSVSGSSVTDVCYKRSVEITGIGLFGGFVRLNYYVTQLYTEKPVITEEPTEEPAVTTEPTEEPTAKPVATAEPTEEPTAEPTEEPLYLDSAMLVRDEDFIYSNDPMNYVPEFTLKDDDKVLVEGIDYEVKYVFLGSEFIGFPVNMDVYSFNAHFSGLGRYSGGFGIMYSVRDLSSRVLPTTVPEDSVEPIFVPEVTEAPTATPSESPVVTVALAITEVPVETKAPMTEAPVATQIPATVTPLETETPVTEAPVVTEVPATVKPVKTEVPATVKPVKTEVPATIKPEVTEVPTTETPVTIKPVETKVPTTINPVTIKPVETKVPTTEKPVATEIPVVTEEPVVKASPLATEEPDIDDDTDDELSDDTKTFIAATAVPVVPSVGTFVSTTKNTEDTADSDVEDVDSGDDSEDNSDFEFSVNGSNATLVSYNGDSKSVVIPSTVTVNGKRYKVTKIANGAFANNRSLTTVTIAKTVTTIGNKAFASCSKLKKIVIKGAKVKFAKKAFKGVSKGTVVKVPAKAKSYYKKALKGTGLVIK